MPGQRDPTRRNRNIGTSKQGHGRNNSDRVPWSWRDSCLEWRRDHPHGVTTRQVSGRRLPFLVERTRSDCFHACTVDDVAAMLELLPELHVNGCERIDGLQGVVFRQPTRKQQHLTPVWARLGYAVEVRGVWGPVIFLEAQQLPVVSPFDNRRGLDDEREFERLAAAADRIEHHRRGDDLFFELAGVRRVQLYHSLPHELGHWADMIEKVELPGLEDADHWRALLERYFQRPGREREEYAHRYAERAVAELRRKGAIPFDRKLDRKVLAADGLHFEDFEPAG